jgi:hypothetical protein
MENCYRDSRAKENSLSSIEGRTGVGENSGEKWTQSNTIGRSLITSIHRTNVNKTT